MTIFDSTVDSVFFPSSTQSAQLESLSQRALNSGLEAYVAKKYDEAIVLFKRSVGLAPASATAIYAYDYMARSHIAQGDNHSAIDIYKKSLRADPSSDSTHTALANLFYSDGRYTEARDEYEQAVKVNPSAANRYSLGQGYLATGQYAEAVQQFQKVHDMAPLEPNGDFGLGQAYARQGRSSDAVSAFQRAIDLQPDYLDAYSEMGYVHADNGDMDKAQEIADLLQAKASPLADTLSQYIYEQSAP
ncbi:MAG: tetratricopeptide repeat protein, partial [Hydrogenophilaceae bacterium]